jgi:hypothetical protein
VGSEAHFFEFLEYVKPVDLLTPYNSGFLAAKSTGELEFFHQEIRSFFEAYAVYMTQYQQRWDHVQRMYVQRPVTRIPYFYNGTCHGSARNKIGVKISVRRTKAHQERIRAKVLNAREDEMDQRYNQANQAEDCHE